MGRYTGPKEKLSRREGQNLYLKGPRSSGDKSAFVKKPQAPGMHGNTRGRLSDYGLQLREKQKVKRIYGVWERQFKKYYKEAVKEGGITGENLLSILERRLDNVIYRLGLAVSRSQARKWVNQGKFIVNGTKTDIPSFRVSEGDVIKLKEGFDPGIPEEHEIPDWMNWNEKKKELEVEDYPTRDDVTDDIQEQLIVEFYSR